ncbi:MAG: glutamate-1-semialdehyde 2,1-aminomutase [Succinivibrionaceae bacterium]|nr:glutamate-1-semialdehyde 2,1-aminomutase [Succinivibrionaceae bacterium]
MNEEKSRSLFEASKHLMPGGVNSPVRAYRNVGRIPRFIQKASGSHITDADGNTYIDYVCSWGPAILGHSHPKVVEAVVKAASCGLSFGAPTEAELKLARLVNRFMPNVESLRLVSSGTEAVMSAIRLARGYTGRDKIIKFRGCYHGHSDAMLVKAGSGALTGSAPDSAGVTSGASRDTLVAEYNSIESVKALFEANPHQVAAVIVEPIAANMGVVIPKDEFLDGLRQITSECGALLIFDEVITGFRLSFGGAAEYFGIGPDLVTLGKIIGGGMPMGAYGGRREIMEMVAPSGKVYQAGTLSGNPMATAAGIATLEEILVHREMYSLLDAKGAKIEKALKAKFGDGATVNRAGSLLSVFFAKGPVDSYDSVMRSDLEKFRAFFSHMLDRGIYLPPSQYEAWFVSLAHDDEDIRRTCQAINDF